MSAFIYVYWFANNLPCLAIARQQCKAFPKKSHLLQ